MTLTWPDAKLELANKKPEGKTIKEWTVAEGDELKLDTGKVRDLVNFLSNLRVDRFAQYTADLKPEYGLEQAVLVIDVKVEGESSPKTLRVGAPAEGEKRYVAGDSSGAVALVDENRLKDLVTGPSHFAQPEAPKAGEKPGDTPKAGTGSEKSEATPAPKETE